MRLLGNHTNTSNSDIIIRRAKPDDAAIVSLIGGAAFLETFYDSISSADILAHAGGPHSEEYYRAALNSDENSLWLAVHKDTDTPVGYQMLSPPDFPIATNADDIELKRIYIFARHQGSDLAKKMEKLASEEARSRGCKRLLLGVYSENLRAITFYQKCGFEKIGDRVFTVGDSDYKDWIMGKNLA